MAIASSRSRWRSGDSAGNARQSPPPRRPEPQNNSVRTSVPDCSKPVFTLKIFTTSRRAQNMLGVGEKFPSYSLSAVVSLDKGQEFATITDESYKGKWKIYFFWPKDFTFVCPTEIAGFGKHDRDFKERDAQILGASVDSEWVHLGWRKSHDDLRTLPFPMLSDFKRELSGELGILDPVVGAAQRAAYIVDPDGIIRFVYVTDLSVGREPKEVLRVLDALQTDELCPCGWQKGDEVLRV